MGDDWFAANLARRDMAVLELGREVVGVLTTEDTGTDLYLGYVYLHTDWVGHGLGRVLLDHARRAARRAGRTGLVLLCHPDATWAVRAYEKYGFTCIARAREAVRSWNQGWLGDRYEEGFALFRYALDDDDTV